MTVKLWRSSRCRPAVVTVIGPLLAAAGTVAVIRLAESTVYAVAAAPLKVTAVAPVRSLPVIVTLVPTRPLSGLKRA